MQENSAHRRPSNNLLVFAQPSRRLGTRSISYFYFFQANSLIEIYGSLVVCSVILSALSWGEAGESFAHVHRFETSCNFGIKLVN